MATIREVARSAGVSVSTVSHVVNETRFVSEETRVRVVEAMNGLGYEPNRLASSLRRKDKQTHTLGLLIPDSANPFFAEVLRGVEDASYEAGYNVILCNSDNDPEKEADYLSVLFSKQVDGIVLVSAGTSKASLNLLSARQATIVAVDREIEGANLDSVAVDNELGGYDATRHLIDLGHTRIGCITGPSPLAPSEGRVRGYRRALAEAGIPADDRLVVAGDFGPHSGYTAASELVKLNPAPSAVFALNDMMAVGALSAIHDAGLRVPDDVSIVGFDDIALASFIVPHLTTVAQPSYEMGMLAAELLVARLGNPSAPSRHERLTPHLAIRESSRAKRG